MSDPYAQLIVVLSAIGCLIILFSLYRFLARQGLQSALLGMVIMLTLGTEYCLRPVMIITSGEFGWEPSVMRPLAASDASSLAIASTIILLALAVFSFCTALSSHPRAGDNSDSSGPFQGTQQASSMRLPTGALATVGILVSAMIALRLGRIGGSLQGDFGRLRFGSGYTYLLVNLAGLSVVVALASLPLEALTRRGTKVVLGLSYAVFVGVHFLILGGRAEIIIVTISILMVTTARLEKPRKVALVFGLMLASVLLGLQRVSTREAFAPQNRNAAPSKLAVEALRDPLALLTRYDVSAYDKLVLLEQAEGDLGHGETYVAALLGPIPGAGVSNLEGGNREFTKRFLPRRYARGVTYEGISMFGEARYNFGWLGPPLAGALAGGAYGALVKRARRSRTWLVTLAVATGILPSLVRADALNTSALGGSLIVLTLLIWLAAARRQHRHQAGATDVELVTLAVSARPS